MSNELSGGSPTGGLLGRRPLFWAGTVLWTAVLIYGLQHLSKRQQETTTESGASAEKEANFVEDEPKPKEIRLTVDKDGKTVVRQGPASENPWDADGVADFEFVDTEGRTVTKQSLLGKPWIVCFVFTHCAATCPAVTQSMREVQDQLKEYDFRLVSMTVDPERDTPDVLREYGRVRGADFSRWSFIHGAQADIYRLIHGSFKMPVKESFGKDRQPGFEFIHSNNIMLVDDKGVVKGKFDATKGEAMATLKREIKALAKRAE